MKNVRQIIQRSMLTANRLFLFCLLFFAAYAVQTQPHFHLRRADLDHQASRGNGGAGVAGFILGPILFIFSFIFIWNNERKAAIDTRRLQLAHTLVVEVNPFVQQQVTDANMKLTHISGKTETRETLRDDLAAIFINDAVKLDRQVEVKELRDTGSGDNRRTEMMWVSTHSSENGNSESAWFIKNETFKAHEARVGCYSLNQSQKDRLQCQQTFRPTMDNARAICQNTGRYNTQPTISGDYICFPGEGGLEGRGALRVKYAYCPNGNVSIIACTSKNSFIPFEIDRYENNGENDRDSTCGDCCCCFLSTCTQKLMAPITEVDLIVQELKSYQEMIKHELSMVKCRTTAFRILAFFMMVGGICLFFSPITQLLGYIPLIGGLLSGTVGILIFVAAIIICIPLFLLAVAVSWLIFHPKVGLIILGVALVITGIVLALCLTNKPSPAATASTHHLQSIFL